MDKIITDNLEIDPSLRRSEHVQDRILPLLEQCLETIHSGLDEDGLYLHTCEHRKLARDALLEYRKVGLFYEEPKSPAPQ